MKRIILALLALSLPALAQSSPPENPADKPARRSARERNLQHGHGIRLDLDLDLEEMGIDLARMGAQLGEQLGSELGHLDGWWDLEELGESMGPLAFGGRDDDRRDEHREPRGNSDHEENRTGEAKGHGSASLAVKGPIIFRVRAQSGDVEIVQGDKPQVSVSISEAPREDLTLAAYGDRVEVEFSGRHQLRRGRLHVEVPKGSSVDLSSMSGDISAHGSLGEARIRTLSGDIKLGNVSKADVQSISGDIVIESASGPVRLHTVSGKATVATTQPTAQVEFQSASGDFDWSGACIKECHVSAETVSGDVRMSLDAKSSFELSYTSHSGDLRDELPLAIKHPMKRKHDGMSGGWLEATYGKGEGLIECDAFSGTLSVKKR